MAARVCLAELSSFSSMSPSAIPSLKAFLLCPRALASCGSLLPPKRRKITAITKIQIIGLSGSNSINAFIRNSFANQLAENSTTGALFIYAQGIAGVRFVKKILAPGLIRPAQIAHNLPVHMKRKATRAAQQMHPGFFRSAIALAMIASLAAGHQVIPGRISTARSRQHMVQGELRRRKLFATILAARMITQQNVFARQRTALEGDVYVFSQANN